MKDLSNPWEIREEWLPENASRADLLEFLLHYSILAPSSYNTQPWHFRFSRNGVDLLADRSRGLESIDPEDREVIIGCGSALGNLDVAAAHFGFGLQVTLFPDRSEPDLLAHVELGRPVDPDIDVTLMFGAITKRRNNLLEFFENPIPEELLELLAETVQREGVWLRFVSGDATRAAIVGLIEQADRVQWADPGFRRELARWVHPNRKRAVDGVSGAALGMGEFVSRAAPLIVRRVDLGRRRAAHDRDVAWHAPVLAVLGSDGDSESDWIAAGRAVSKVLLRARAEDVWASFLNQPLEIPELRSQIADRMQQPGFPQVIMRLGFGFDVSPSPRRSMKDVLLPPKNFARQVH
ncbi:MAG: nitroreductase [Verrucomicrobia bacterium]|nr:nitroreductase [Verrucomicrobiota bacterium]